MKSTHPEILSQITPHLAHISQEHHLTVAPCPGTGSPEDKGTAVTLLGATCAALKPPELQTSLSKKTSGSRPLKHVTFSREHFVRFSFFNLFCYIWSWKGGVIFKLPFFISGAGSYWTENWISSHAFESWNFNKNTAILQLPVKHAKMISDCMNQLRKPSPKFLNGTFLPIWHFCGYQVQFY